MTITARSRLAGVWATTTTLPVVSGSGSWVTTADGERYLDFTAGIAVASTGHCHPHVVEAIQRQAATLVHGQVNCYHHSLLDPLAERLDSITPDGIDTFFFSNSGAEITEAAVKLAKAATGRGNVVVFSGSFHGRTHLAMAMTTSKTGYRVGYANLPPGRVRGPVPRRAPRRRSRRPGRRGRRVASAPCGLLLATQTAPADTAAIVLEPVHRRRRLPAVSAGVPARRRRPLPRGRRAVRRRRGADRVRAHRHDVRRRALRRAARRLDDGQGDRLGPAAQRPRCVGRADGALAGRLARGHVRGQPDRLRGGARHDRRARAPMASSTPSRRGASSSAPGLRQVAADADGAIVHTRGPRPDERRRVRRPGALQGGRSPTCSTRARVITMAAGVDGATLRWMPPLVVTADEVDLALHAFATGGRRPPRP